jgi:hypothetical protein
LTLDKVSKIGDKSMNQDKTLEMSLAPRKKSYQAPKLHLDILSDTKHKSIHVATEGTQPGISTAHPVWTFSPC